MKKFKLTKLFKENFKTIIAIIITALLIGGTTAFASYNYFAKDVEYEKEDGTKISTQDALNELYKKTSVSIEEKRNIVYVTGTNNASSGVETIEIQYDSDNAAIFSGQSSLLFSVNTEENYQSMEALGINYNGIGFYYAYLSVKKGDKIYIKRDTSCLYGYAIIY